MFDYMDAGSVMAILIAGVYPLGSYAGGRNLGQRRVESSNWDPYYPRCSKTKTNVTKFPRSVAEQTFHPLRKRMGQRLKRRLRCKDDDIKCPSGKRHKWWKKGFSDVNKENNALRARIREVEDENQELQAQSLIQNRTILGMRNELALMRIQLNEMAVTSALLTERVRQMMQQPRMNQLGEFQNNGNQIMAPPLMAPPPPPPPPISPTYIRITPRQVGAGEALMTRLGLTVPTPPRHRIKRDIRQPVRRLSRSPTERSNHNDNSSAQTSLIRSKNLNGLPKLQIQGISQGSECHESASDSSDSEEDSQSCQRRKRDESGIIQKTILQNYSFKFPSTNIFLNCERKDKDNQTVPSTSRMENDLVYVESDFKRSRISECVQYTFPNLHEGSHQSDVRSVVTAVGQSVRTKPSDDSEASKPEEKKGEESAATSQDNRSEYETPPNPGFESESQSSTDEDLRRKESGREIPCVRGGRFDTEQDGFQADESSNCITSTENSLERVAISEADLEKN